VKFQEGQRYAEAERGVLDRATDTLTLSGGARVVDAQSRTSAANLSFQQRSGEIRGSGGVRTTYSAGGRDAAINLAPHAAHISADRLLANRDSGRAVYSGHARLWQGDAVIEAEEMELFREERKLEARGRVQALLPQSDASASAKAAKPGFVMWRIRAARLAYWSSESRAKLEEDAWAQSRLGEIRARNIELFFSAPSGGAQQLERGIATGGVTVLASSVPDQRRGISERAEYTAAEGKFVLSGGKPTLFDPVLGSTSGRQLTFFLADDKILVESEEGFRTLSRHRVEK
jgi:lipopolysaccharide export system protein LptA